MAPGLVLWRAVCAPDSALEPCDVVEESALRAAATRFAWLTSPTIAAFLLAPLESRLPGLVPKAGIERARQFNRFIRARARDELARINEAGVPVLALKGFATATRFYGDPDIRSMGDVDLLVRPADLDRLCDLLEARGFRFLKSAEVPVWGLASESSFHPVVAADGSLTFDLHVAADDYPVARALPLDEVFSHARNVAVAGVPVAVPSDDHLFFLAVTNAARDKFDPAAMRSITDMIVALVHAGYQPDWDALTALARRGGVTRPLRVAVHLLAFLGVDRALLPTALLRPYRGAARMAFAALANDVATVFAHEPTRLAKQLRDWLLISSPDVLVHRNARRLRGLLRPWTGLPPGRRFGAS